MRTILVPNCLNNFCCADILNCNANKRMWQWQWVETVVLAKPCKRPKHLARQIGASRKGPHEDLGPQ